MAWHGTAICARMPCRAGQDAREKMRALATELHCAAVPPYEEGARARKVPRERASSESRARDPPRSQERRAARVSLQRLRERPSPVSAFPPAGRCSRTAWRSRTVCCFARVPSAWAPQIPSPLPLRASRRARGRASSADARRARGPRRAHIRKVPRGVPILGRCPTRAHIRKVPQARPY